VHAVTFPQVVPHVDDEERLVSHPSEGEPSQSRVPAAHATHAPPEQVCVVAVHAAAAPHWPLESQVCTPLPEHCFAPGVHTPVQAPLTQAEETHVDAVPQLPFASHVCTPLFEHCFVPGAQVPAQAPPTHA
jgi:hypothetical protein